MARLEVGIESGSQLQFYQAIWGSVYEGVLNVIGNTGVILPIGDPHHGQPSATTFTTVGEEQVTFTWSEALNAFDTGLDLTSPGSFQGIVPTVSFNGSDEEANTPDAAFWSRDDSGSNPFSIGIWINITDTAAIRKLLSRWDGTTPLREWTLYINDSDKLLMQLYDESENVGAQRISNTAIAMGNWVFLVMTYDSTGGATAGTGITLYADGSEIASTPNEDVSYVAMEDLAVATTLGVNVGGGLPFDGKMAGGPLGPFFASKELSADEVLRLYEVGRRALAL
jgi:hypothetical protein